MKIAQNPTQSPSKVTRGSGQREPPAAFGSMSGLFARLGRSVRAAVGGYKREEVKDEDYNALVAKWAPVGPTATRVRDATMAWAAADSKLEASSLHFLSCCDALLYMVEREELGDAGAGDKKEVGGYPVTALSKAASRMRGKPAHASHLAQFESGLDTLSKIADQHSKVKQHTVERGSAKSLYEYYIAKENKLKTDAKAAQARGKVAKPAALAKLERARDKRRATGEAFDKVNAACKDQMRKAVNTKNQSLDPALQGILSAAAQQQNAWSEFYETAEGFVGKRTRISCSVEDILGLGDGTANDEKWITKPNTEKTTKIKTKIASKQSNSKHDTTTQTTPTPPIASENKVMGWMSSVSTATPQTDRHQASVPSLSDCESGDVQGGMDLESIAERRPEAPPPHRVSYSSRHRRSDTVELDAPPLGDSFPRISEDNSVSDDDGLNRRDTVEIPKAQRILRTDTIDRMNFITASTHHTFEGKTGQHQKRDSEHAMIGLQSTPLPPRIPPRRSSISSRGERPPPIPRKKRSSMPSSVPTRPLCNMISRAGRSGSAPFTTRLNAMPNPPKRSPPPLPASAPPKVPPSDQNEIKK